MPDVSIRVLRDHADDVVDRVERGERVVVTRAGKAVAELRPIRLTVGRDELRARWLHLPPIDPAAFRRDLDEAQLGS